VTGVKRCHTRAEGLHPGVESGTRKDKHRPQQILILIAGCSAPATTGFGLPSLSELLHRSECLTGALLGETQVFSRSISEHVG